MDKFCTKWTTKKTVPSEPKTTKYAIRSDTGNICIASTFHKVTLNASDRDGSADFLKCAGCSEPVHFVKEHKRVINGATYSVCSHFRHNSESKCVGGETFIHRVSKLLLQTHGHDMDFYKVCGIDGCDKKIRLDIFGDVANRRVEVETRIDELDVIVDVATFNGSVNANGDTLWKMIGAIEVFNTHKCSDEKCEKLSSHHNIAWAEIQCDMLLQSWEEYNNMDMDCMISDEPSKCEVEVFRCAHTMCDTCNARYSLVDNLEMKQRILACKKRALESTVELNNKRVLLCELEESENQLKESNRQLEELKELVEVSTERIDKLKCTHSATTTSMTGITKDRDDKMKKVSSNIYARLGEILTFGKYKMQHWRVVFEVDPGYFNCPLVLDHLPFTVKRYIDNHCIANQLCRDCFVDDENITRWRPKCKDCFWKTK